MPPTPDETVVALTTEIVCAFVGSKPVRPTELPEIIRAVHSSLVALAHPQPENGRDEAPVPAVSVAKSIAYDYLICLEDGKRFKSLKRHLSVAYGMTPEQYRAKWNLSRDYPMVSASYASARSTLARRMGLGQKTKAAGPGVNAKAPATDDVAFETVSDSRRGRSRKMA